MLAFVATADVFMLVFLEGKTGAISSCYSMFDLTDAKQEMKSPGQKVERALRVLYSGAISPKTFVEKYLNIISEIIAAIDLKAPPEVGRGGGPGSLGFGRSTLSLEYGAKFHIGPMPLSSHITYLLNIEQTLLESGHPSEAGLARQKLLGLRQWSRDDIASRADEREILGILSALKQYSAVHDNETAERVYDGLLQLLSPEAKKYLIFLLGRAITFLDRQRGGPYHLNPP